MVLPFVPVTPTSVEMRRSDRRRAAPPRGPRSRARLAASHHAWRPAPRASPSATTARAPRASASATCRRPSVAAGEREEDVAGCDAARVDRDAGDVDVGIPSTATASETVEQRCRAASRDAPSADPVAARAPAGDRRASGVPGRGSCSAT